MWVHPSQKLQSITKDSDIMKVQLLFEAVTEYAASPTINFEQNPKVSWKFVAEYIWKNGGSYQFGNATCKKKWAELRQQSPLA